ncbi:MULTISPECIES: MurT ligase domain-containing protein [unclassified Cryobacterium]|uniref:MurT ligase domain-containing protein n=1 Tax=unclassified Cryobacterium TaxID=2649013 RepID=UPI002AB4D12F|nr:MULTISPECIES: MurT ligase domain-containing protein [unclassified Cryobacterium]MDY7543847.1 MurT ligase domain-containing protein [Cryobacterium sp. 5B3]MEA9998526.1 MurT ligase domain-containing protein [Cryobacterium sp. RTS3]MEB0264434.1 MurT ligase domain-containing protein [Cryobacterium sp. 10I5]MEB0273559.1 MurT ligase domain-containing protein [Cryobacterium sp. 5B3]
MRYAPAILVGRTVRVLARWRKPGGGSAVPGLVVNKIAPGFLASVLNSFPDGLVIVSGSSGKSTTTKMLVAALRAHGVAVFTNQSTANISQGLTSALLEEVSLSGRIHGDMAVLEMDEGHGALISATLNPRVVALTNVMVDQIDRFHDSDMVVAMLARIANRASGTVVINADDASLTGLSERLDGPAVIARYGVTAEVLAENPRGLGYSLTASERMPAAGGVLLTSVSGRSASVLLEGASFDLELPARGVHYAVDALTAIAAARAALGDRFDAATACSAVSTIPPVFGRGEIVTVRGHRVEFVLVQNPASFQLNVDSLEPGLDQVLVAIGSDVRDPSYFWPVDTSALGRVLIASGSKAHDIALQLAYDGVIVDRIEPDLGRALDDFLALPDPVHGIKTIIFSADSMRRTRAHLGLASNREG